MLKYVIHYSGFEFIWCKFNPQVPTRPLPNGFIWLLGIYVAFFGVASQRYENRVDIIENRANAIFAQLPVDLVRKKALSRISSVQNMSCPFKPDIRNPFSVFRSLFKESRYPEIVKLLGKTIENWKLSLDGTNLSNAQLAYAHLPFANLEGTDLYGANLEDAFLQNAKLKGANLNKTNLSRAWLEADLEDAILANANLEGAIMWDANLRGANFDRAKMKGVNLFNANLRYAKGLTVSQLSKADTLFKAKIDADLVERLKKVCPHLLESPESKLIPPEVSPEEKALPQYMR